jgi:4-amino-4-deoxy-L-arabinose transferase-like glycosyltransferase
MSGRRFVAIAIANWPVLIPLVLLAIAATIVPTMSNVATTDDWGYTRAVEILYYDSELVMFPVVAATAVGQVLWGGLFALVFGMELGVMRLSTVVMVGLGAVALYSILRQLGVTRGRSSLGMALYLFNPLTFVLTFTFMTDPHFASWMLIAVALYLRGLRPDDMKPSVIVGASIVAGFAFWIRQQGALIPAAIVLYLLLSRRLWLNWRSVRLGLQVALAPAIMLIAYYAWLYWLNDVPSVQENFLDRAVDEGWNGTWFLVRHLPFFDAMYLGLFLLPLAIALLPGFRRPARQPFFASAWGYWAFLVTLGLLVFGLFQLSFQGRRMPYIPQFLGSGGFGPADVPGGRRRVVEWDQVWSGLTVAAAVGAILLALFLSRTVRTGVSLERAGAGLVGMVAIWQVIGMIPASYQYIDRGGSLDRYILPFIPLTIALAFWAVRDVQLVQPAVWVGVALFAAVSVAGTRDYLVYLDAVWEMAEEANAAGVPNEKMDAGSAWDGYHLYTDMLDLGITKSLSPRGSPWWVYFYAKQTDSTYMVTTNPAWRNGYFVVERREYDQWLEDDPVYVYIVRRWDAPWPPRP